MEPSCRLPETALDFVLHRSPIWPWMKMGISTFLILGEGAAMTYEPYASKAIKKALKLLKKYVPQVHAAIRARAKRTRMLFRSMCRVHYCSCVARWHCTCMQRASAF
uniref:Uncharacterized protein n=1 Tax=Lotharella oceanica TaxID=641309 RepID=A0A7S2XCN2_9EUKA|mmetsp:Transcript_23719/g.44310  ORF Transcript_23719/g.44310 Transcript_23719/m.44310 type:complete len:107 (+) Transcript_23719:396-716(+)